MLKPTRGRAFARASSAWRMSSSLTSAQVADAEDLAGKLPLAARHHHAVLVLEQSCAAPSPPRPPGTSWPSRCWRRTARRRQQLQPQRLHALRARCARCAGGGRGCSPAPPLPSSPGRVQAEEDRHRRRPGRLPLVEAGPRSWPRRSRSAASCADSFAFQARSLRQTKARPGGTIQPFCEPVTTTSSPQPSVSSGIEPRLLTASTSSSLSASRTTRAISSRGFVTPVEVSLWVTSTALMLGSSASALRTSSGSAACPTRRGAASPRRRRSRRSPRTGRRRRRCRRPAPCRPARAC